MVIWKFPFTYPDIGKDGAFTLRIPMPFKVLTVQMQDSIPCIWAKVDPQIPPQPIRFFVVGTGHRIPDGATDYVGTYQDGPYVWHIFEGGHHS